MKIWGVVRLAVAVLAAGLVLSAASVAADTYNLPKQFSDTQGADGWTYVFGDAYDGPELAAWDEKVEPYGVQAYASWNGGFGFSGPRYLQVRGRDLADFRNIGGGWAQVGEGADFSFIWTAPADGTVRIAAMVNTAYPDPRPGPWWCDMPPGWCEDGLYVSLWHGATMIAGEERIFHGRELADRVPDVTLRAVADVAAGDRIAWYLRRGDWQDADGAYYSITISYEDDADLTAPESSAKLMGRILTISAVDDLSGVAMLEQAPLDDPSAGWSPVTERVRVLEPGSYDFLYRALDETGNLEPYHRFTATVADDLPTLMASLQGACELGWITKPGICHSLQVKLDAAEDSVERVRLDAAENQLQAFLHELSAQRGKAVSDAAYLLLSADALKVIDSLR